MRESTGLVRCVALGTFVLMAFASRLASQDLPKLLHRTTVVSVDPATSSATGTLHLRNDGKAAIRAQISAGEFISKTTNKGLDARATFTGPADRTAASVLAVTVPPNEVVPVRIDVANAWEAGESEADVLANGTSIGTVRVLKYRLPFNVKVVAANPDKPELAFVQGETRQLALRNDDAMTYVVRPALAVRGHTLEAPSLVLPPNSSRAVAITPPAAWFGSFAGKLKQEQVDGLMTLRFEPPGAASDPTWPTRVIPFTAALSSLSPTTQTLAGLGFILLLLVAGGLCSLVLRYWLPNSLRRASVRDRLNQVAESTRLLSARTSSEIRVGLRVERQRLTERLKSRWTFSPELPAILSEIDGRIDDLITHLQLVNELNELWKRLDLQFRNGEAPSRLSPLEDRVRSISDSLKRIPSTKTELQAIHLKIAEVIAKLDESPKSDTEWKTTLGEGFTELEAERQGLEAAYPPCGELFDMWAGGWVGIKPESYNRLDRRISLLRLIQPNVRALGSATGRAAKDFSDALQRVDYRAARKAMREIYEGVYREQVVDALKAKQPAPSIYVAQVKVRAFFPVQFAIRFPKRAMDNSEALDAIQCQWDFGHDEFKENGWWVTHYFPRPRTYVVKARFSYEGQPILDANNAPVEVSETITAEAVPRVTQDRTRVELIQLGIVLLVALLGLLAGAREQLQKLDLLAATVALFLLGFTADSIKNAIAPPKTEKTP